MEFLAIPTHDSGIFNQIKHSSSLKIVSNINKAEGNETVLARKHTYPTPLKKQNNWNEEDRRRSKKESATASLSHLFFE
jgi:hypothetical protein